MSCPAEMLGRSVPREEEVPNKKHEVHEGSEWDRPEVAGALRVFTGSETDVETNGEQVGDMVSSRFKEVAALEMIDWTIPRGIAFSRQTGGSSRP